MHVPFALFLTYIFFFPPFLPPLVRRLFLPTAILTCGLEKERVRQGRFTRKLHSTRSGPSEAD